MDDTPASDGTAPRRTLRRKASKKNYDENLMDELIDEHLGGNSKKKFKTKKALEKETETEALIALSVGFPIDELLEEETRAGVVKELGGKEQNDYIVVRNHIVARWRSNVRVWLTKDQIRETVSSDCEHLISAAYDFLSSNGYINFGVSPLFAPHIPEEPTEGSVIIVGAGLAGLAAAKQLLSFGFKVLVLEARSRPGGRVYTQKMGHKGNFAAVELGGSVITGLHANPLGVLARQLSIPLHKVRDDCPLYNTDGANVDKVADANVEFGFNKLLDKVTEVREMMDGEANKISLGEVLEKLRVLYGVAKDTEERKLFDWHLANLEYANAGCLSNLSAAYWDQDDPYEMGGDHCFLAGGNWRLINALAEGLPIIYGKTVDSIRYGERGVEVVSGRQTFQADMILCTVPLGVLKKRSIKFVPELPSRKLAAVDRLGFGLLNKVAMLFPSVFWGDELDTFGCLSESSNNRGEFFLFYGYHTVSGGPALVALVAGEAAQRFENTEPSVLLHRVLKKLRGIYGPKGVVVPDPIQTICTRWGSDPFSYGSYSHVRVGSSGEDYVIVAESVNNRLFFAGEATTRQHPATMHGAYLSGLREASHIQQVVNKSRNNNPKKPVQRSSGVNKDVLEDLLKLPDTATGKFSFVFNPLIGDPKSVGLVRVCFGSSEEDDPSNGLQLYAFLSREQAQRLQELEESSNESILGYLVNTMGLKLMGAKGILDTGGALVSIIANARKARSRTRVKPPTAH